MKSAIMKVSGIIKQLKSGKYIIELTSGYEIFRGKVEVVINATTTLSSAVYQLKDKSILFLTHQLFHDLGLILHDKIELQLMHNPSSEMSGRKLPVALLY